MGHPVVSRSRPMQRASTVRALAAAGLGAGLVATAGATSAAAAAPPVVPDKGLHLSVGSVLGTDAQAMIYPESGGVQYSGITVPAYLKWSLDPSVVAMGDTSGDHYSIVFTQDASEDGGLDCCTPRWSWSDLRTSFAGSTGYPLFGRDATVTTNGDARTDVDFETKNTAGVWNYTSASYRLYVTQEKAAKYSAGWTTGTGKIWSGGSVLKSTAAGQTATFTATANEFAVVTDHGTGRGTADVYLDGHKFASINDLGTSVNRVIDAQIYKPTRGTHTMKVVVTNGRIDIDAFVTS